MAQSAPHHSLEAAVKIYSAPSSVLMYIIDDKNTVSSACQPSDLSLFQLPGDVEAGQPWGFLVVDDWTHALVPDSSSAAVLCTHDQCYVFPMTDRAGCFVAVKFCDTSAASGRCHFEQLLVAAGCAVHHESAPASLPAEPAPHSDTDPLSSSIESVGEFVSGALVAGADRLADWASMGTAHVIQRLQPAEGASGAATPVSSQVQQTASTVRAVSSAVLRVSELAADVVSRGTVSLANTFAPHVKHVGLKALYAAGVPDNAHTDKTLERVTVTAASGATAVSTALTGLDQAARLLATRLAENAVQVSRHRYGDAAAAVTDDALAASANLLLCGRNLRPLGVKSLAASVAKNTGRQLLCQHQSTQNQ